MSEPARVKGFEVFCAGPNGARLNLLRCVVALVLLLSSCRQEGSGTVALPATVPSEPPGSTGDAGPYGVTSEALDRYIALQERSLAIHAETVRELGRMVDAGTGPEAIALVRRHADAMSALRQQAGLTDRDARELERIVFDVISKRALAATGEEEASLTALENLAANLSEQDRARLEASLASVREQQRELEALTEERKRHGDANVDAVLSRERELTRLWQRTIATFAGADASTDAGSRSGSRR